MSSRSVRRRCLLALVAAAALVTTAGAPAPIAHAAGFQDPSPVAALVADADRLIKEQRFEEALLMYDRAVTEARERGSDQQIARALLGRSDLRLRRRIAAGFEDAREALEISERISSMGGTARARLLLGIYEETRGNRDRASQLFAQARDEFSAMGDRENAARAAIRLSAFLDGDERISLLTRAAEDARAARHADLEGNALHDLGDELFNLDRYEESMVALLAAAEAYERAGRTASIGGVHNSMGRVYRAHGRLDEALREQKLALEIHRKTGNPGQLLQSLNAVGVTYLRMGYLEEARKYLEQALALAPAATNLPEARDFLEANIAGSMLSFGEYAKAAETFEGVLQRGLDAFPALRWAQLATAYYHLGRYQDALKAATESTSKCGTQRDQCARAHSLRASVHFALGDRALARRDGQSALDLLEGLRTQLLPTDTNRREFATSLSAVYTNVIGISLADGDVRGGLEAAEQARARAFLDLLESRSLEPVPAPAAEPLTLRGAPTSQRLQSSASAATANELVATAARLGSTLVTYWVGDDETFVWVVNGNGSIHSERIRVPRTTLVRLVRDTQPFSDIESPNRKPFPVATRGASPMSLVGGDVAWTELYTLLIAPIRKALPTASGAMLTIVPHDVLNGLSFAAMKDSRGRYLLEDFTLHYAPAGGLFQFTAPLRQPSARSGSVLLVSDPALPRRSALDEQLARLPGTRAESAAIARYVRRGAATILQDMTATEAQVRELSSSRSVLHFATHAIVREDRPLESQLVLARSGPGAAADGLLTAAEVYGMRLKADLVVLSACRSAAGAVPGDAIATFTRAFLYAGTASMIASLWEVADEPTNRLLPAFYKEWLDGADKAAALRRAQLRLLGELRSGKVSVSTSLGPVPLTEHPVFWAGFVLFGEPR